MSTLTMGVYGIYVWPAYGATAAVVFVMITSTLRALRKAERSLAAHDELSRLRKNKEK